MSGDVVIRTSVYVDGTVVLVEDMPAAPGITGQRGSVRYQVDGALLDIAITAEATVRRLLDFPPAAEPDDVREAGRRLRAMLLCFHDVDRQTCRRPCHACEALERWEGVDPL